MEYKSLPSGLHAVQEDLIYFRHANLAGASAFVQGEADAQHRNANFVAVGVLVPLSGALGRVWEHAEELKGLARNVVGNGEDTAVLETFWEEHKLESAAASDSKKRKRGGSEATLPAFDLESTWSKEHPALAVPDMMDLFGPLLFPLQRAVLARKRVLVLGSPPVRSNALVVWLASVLGNVSRDVGGDLEADLLKTMPLFSVGIHDISSLPGKEDGKGWLACTTDDILGEKKDLWDVLVKLPAHSSQIKTWPTLQSSDGRVIKASQRDSRRWTLLQRELRRIRFQICGRYMDDIGAESVNDDDQRPLLERRRTSDDVDVLVRQGRDDDEAVEAPTWTAVAYRGFMWCASAGEASAWEEDEAKADEELLFDLPDMGALSPTIDRKVSRERDAQYARASATMLVAYFRRITERILSTLTSIVEEADDDTEEGVQADDVQIRGDDLRQIGLDRWSDADRLFFVQDMMDKWFDRKAVVVDEGLTLCGVRLC